MQHSSDVALDGARVFPFGVAGRREMGPFKFTHLAVGAPMGAYNNSLRNALVGLQRRVLYKYDKRNNTYSERMVPSASVVDEVIGRFGHKFVCRNRPSVRCERRDYPKLYTGAKRKIYERADVSLVTIPLSRRDAHLGAFVKVEPTKDEADPRVIQTRTPRYHASFGCYIKPNEKAFYAGVDMHFGERTSTKGLNAKQVGELIASKFESFSDPVAVGLDASRFDRSVSIPVLKWVHGIYKRFIGKDIDFLEMLDWQLHNIGKVRAVDGIIKYEVDGGVMSGDVDTSLKGCLIMCALVGSWLERCGVPAKLINNGDDCVLFCDRKHLTQLQTGMTEHFARLGFDIVSEEPVYEIEKVEFCQAKPVLCSEGTYIMCRNPVKASVKDSMSRLNLKDKGVAKRWCGAVAQCGMALAGDMPIFSEYYGVYERFAEGVDVRWVHEHNMFGNGLTWYAKGLKRREGVTDATRISFWRAWDILPHEQRLIEGYYHGLTLDDVYMGPIENLSPTSFHAPETVCYLSNGSKQ